MGRTLLANDVENAVVRVLNLSDKPCYLAENELLGEAVPVRCHKTSGSEIQPNDGHEHVQCVIDVLPSILTTKNVLVSRNSFAVKHMFFPNQSTTWQEITGYRIA